MILSKQDNRELIWKARPTKGDSDQGRLHWLCKLRVKSGSISLSVTHFSAFYLFFSSFLPLLFSPDLGMTLPELSLQKRLIYTWLIPVMTESIGSRKSMKNTGWRLRLLQSSFILLLLQKGLENSWQYSLYFSRKNAISCLRDVKERQQPILVIFLSFLNPKKIDTLINSKNACSKRTLGSSKQLSRHDRNQIWWNT